MAFLLSVPERGSGWIKNRAGVNADNVVWPAVNGLDLRGSKGYAIAPPSKNYEWVVASGHDFDDMPVFTRPNIEVSKSENVVDFNSWRFEGMPLGDVTVKKPIWQKTQELVDRLESCRRAEATVATTASTSISAPLRVGVSVAMRWLLALTTSWMLSSSTRLTTGR